MCAHIIRVQFALAGQLVMGKVDTNVAKWNLTVRVAILHFIQSAELQLHKHEFSRLDQSEFERAQGLFQCYFKKTM